MSCARPSQPSTAASSPRVTADLRGNELGGDLVRMSQIASELILVSVARPGPQGRERCKVSERSRSKDEVRMIRRPIVSSLSILACLFLAVAPQSAAISLPAQSAGVQIIGTVVDGALSLLAGVAITLNRQGAVIARTTSDAAGRFRFERVAPGEYEVKATHANAPALVRAVRIGAGAKVVNLPLVMASPVKQAEA